MNRLGPLCCAGHRQPAAGVGNSMGAIQIVVVLVLLAIVGSLGTALYFLATGQEGSDKLFRSLAIRVGLSVALFALLMLAWRLGWIHPHAPGR